MAIALHWAVGLALLAQMVFGFLLDDIAPRGTPARAGVINLHKSIGIVLGVLIVLRLAWRLAHRPPAWPRAMSLAQQRAAQWGHRALYALMLAMPLSGYIASNLSKHGVRFFGLVLPPWGPNSPPLYALFNGLHVVAAWALAALVAGHVLAALWHLRRRDGLFERMLPSRRHTP